MGLEQVTEILLDQALPRLTPAQDYVLLDALGDQDGSRFSRSRRRYLTGSWRSDRRAFGWFSDHHFPDFDDRPRPPEAAKSITSRPSFSISKVKLITVL
jgi:hypothetical protein